MCNLVLLLVIAMLRLTCDRQAEKLLFRVIGYSPTCFEFELQNHLYQTPPILQLKGVFSKIPVFILLLLQIQNSQKLAGTSMARGILLESQGNCLLCLFTLFFHVFFFPKTGRCCWFHSHIARWTPVVDLNFLSSRPASGTGGFRGERFVSKRREMSWKDMKRHPIAVVLFYLERGSKGIFCGKKLFKKAHSTELRPMDDIDVIRSFQWLNACHWSSTTCGLAIRRAAGAAYHSLKQKLLEWLGDWSWLYRYYTDTFSTWHFPPNREPQKLDGVFSNSTIKDICFGKNWMTFFWKIHMVHHW